MGELNYRNFILAFLLTLSSIPFSFAQDTITLRNVPWMLTVIAALLVVLSLIVIGYLFSKFFNIKELASWANNELYQIIMMSLIVFFIFGLLRLESFIFEAYGFTPSMRGENPSIDNAKLYLNSVRSYLTFVLGGLLIEKNALSLSNSLLEQAIDSGSKGILKALQNNKYFSGFKIFKIDNKAIAKSFTNVFSSVLEKALAPFTFVYAFNSMQLYFLEFIERYAFHFFLPFGLFFRVFSFSRKFGNILIALSIGFYIVFPLTYLISQSIVDSVLNFGKVGNQYSWKDILGARMGQTNNAVSDLSGSSWVDRLKEELTREIANPIANGISFAIKLVFALFSEAAFAFVLFTLVPIIGFTITVSVVRDLGSLLGSDIAVNDLLKML
ncbi:MAG: hypothetical protein N3G74_00710 [Candidatus Micrarchaeota archaeon]|nr:hypothetical protein [Candidatus Micrarchaeota archaeon]